MPGEAVSTNRGGFMGRCLESHCREQWMCTVEWELEYVQELDTLAKKWSVWSLTSRTSPIVYHFSLSYICTHSWKWQHLNYWDVSSALIFPEEEAWYCHKQTRISLGKILKCLTWFWEWDRNILSVYILFYCTKCYVRSNTYAPRKWAFFRGVVIGECYRVEFWLESDAAFIHLTARDTMEWVIKSIRSRGCLINHINKFVLSPANGRLCNRYQRYGDEWSFLSRVYR